MNDQAYLNRNYFLALKAAAAASPAEACLKFGVTMEMAQKVAEMSLSEIDALSQCDRVLFKPVLEPGAFMTIAGVQSPGAREILMGLAKH